MIILLLAYLFFNSIKLSERKKKLFKFLSSRLINKKVSAFPGISSKPFSPKPCFSLKVLTRNPRFKGQHVTHSLSLTYHPMQNMSSNKNLTKKILAESGLPYQTLFRPTFCVRPPVESDIKETPIGVNNRNGYFRKGVNTVFSLCSRE
ncbi:hypothetical protein CEXT_489781 [Caerostris extrusa]|uniref:Uncharacterized protein n=1 Tax=Caerostris extrusa TaxID=172846 RepID=A0AAV4PHX0_CAEEX|nr:hypothetical protein CEXT_489781 [Caerostris extrusa]